MALAVSSLALWRTFLVPYMKHFICTTTTADFKRWRVARSHEAKRKPALGKAAKEKSIIRCVSIGLIGPQNESRIELIE